ncbi:MAG: radical SAM protein [Candidatus Omnitrophota bacterium]|jgi:MoaA/NifB/PqqE/SkfB family radical SAM enzyme
MAIKSFLRKISFKENKRRLLTVRGILSRKVAYRAPDVVQIDLTDRCTGGCVICWNHSPHIKKEGAVKKTDLEFKAAGEFIDSIKAFGTREVIFSGGGEPFVYEHVWEVLEHTNAKGLPFRINTNLLLPDKKDLHRLAGFKYLISLTVSVWAADPFLYARLHDRTPEDFRRIKERLESLNRLKHGNLKVIMYAVVNRVNAHCLKDLAELAYYTGCDAVEFGLVDVIPGVSDRYLLNAAQLSGVKNDFLDILKKSRGLKHFSVNARTRGIFLRRIAGKGACAGEYDAHVGKTPCYAGWLFLRLRANGDFNSCLKSHRMPVGNVYKEDAVSVWNNVLQQEFRRHAVRVPKDKGYFSAIGNCPGKEVGCLRMCDNILINEHVHRFMKYWFKKVKVG